MTTTPKGEAALRLNLPGAPPTWHTVGQHPGLYHPQIPTLLRLVGRDEEWAQRLHDDPGCHVELVRVAASDIAAAEAAFEEACDASVAGVGSALRRGGKGAEADRVKAEQTAAVSGEEG